MRRHVQRLLLGLLAFLRRDVLVLDHAVDDVVAPLDGAVALAERIVIVRPLGQPGKIRRLRDRQLMHGLVEIQQRGGGDPISAEPEIDLVEVQLDDLVLGIGPLDPQREQDLLDLAIEGDLVRQQEILGDLLGDGRGALGPAVAAVVLDVDPAGANDAAEIQPAMLVEILVLGSHERVRHQLGHRLDRQVEPPLAGVFGQQGAVARMDPGHDRRLVILQLRVIREVLGEMPEQAGRRGNADEEHDSSRGEQESEEAHQKPHRRRPAATRIRSIAAVLSRLDAEYTRCLATRGLIVSDNAMRRARRFVAPFCGQTEAGPSP